MSKETIKQLSILAVESKWSPARKLTDEELQQARSMFNEIDSDMSGSIDTEELSAAMRRLGQNPTDQEVRELIFSVDQGDMDGKLQFREFCKLFAMSVDTKGEARQSDVTDCIASFGGDPRNDDETIDADVVAGQLLKDFDLNVDLNYTFGVKDQELTKSDMERIIMKTPRAKS